ncbi:MAG: ribulose-phosphate 3-epimerase [Clostridia bacterium]|nr:ribulose-phosphate 3-epimerase [Clostridia bacterium]
MKQVSPSILASDMLNLGNEIKKIENSGAKYVHIDIMDGCFVPNISFGMPIISAVRKCTDLVLDVHAMIVQPQRYIEEFIKCGADIVTFHIEASNDEDIRASIDLIKSLGKKVGLSIKPKTPAEAVIPYVNDIDMVLVMTVEPGFGGQKFMGETMEKVTEIRDYANKIGKELDIEVDGGINNDTIKIAADAGANIFVLGTGFFKSEEPLTAEQILSKTE